MKKRIYTSKSLSQSGMYNYSDEFCREETIGFLLDYASRSREEINDYWKNMRRYYDGEHDIRKQTCSIYEKNSLPWRAAQSTDGYVHVESLIEADIPDFEFSPRKDQNSLLAKQREAITRFVLDSNDMQYKNSRNERRLGIYGSAVWKVCWGEKAFATGGNNGDVCIDTPSLEQIFPDPSASDLDSCEYIGYVYKMHKQRAKRVFKKDLKSKNCDITEYINTYHSSNVYDTLDYSGDDETVTITEWWFRQPNDGQMIVRSGCGENERSMKYSWKSGDVALCVLINGKEIKYIPKYWRTTNNRAFPFVIYNKIPSEKSVWGRSELEQIIPLIDASDREMAYAQLNSAFSSNDIILAEENALSDGCEMDNSPGAVWKLRPGMMGKVQRLGNLSAYENSLYNACSFWRTLCEATTGNFEINQGKEPTSVTTATGIALLGERAQSRKTLKNIDRNAGFKRLYSLIDMTALEFYDDGRVIRVSGTDAENIVYRYTDYASGRPGEKYVPALDVVIHTGGNFANSRAFTLSALTTLMNMGITDENYELVKAYLDEISIPQRAQIKAYLDEKFKNEQVSLIENAKEIEEEGKKYEYDR